MPQVELVEIRTADGVRLDGALANPQSGADLNSRQRLPVDAVLTVHGTGSNFYGSSLFGPLVPKLLADGLSVLSANTRGHDTVSNAATTQGPKRLGSAYENVDDCRHDISACCNFLVSRGLKSIAIVGHSLGAIKAVHALTHSPHAAVKRLIAISPPRLSHQYYLNSEHREEFLTQYHAAEQAVAAGDRDRLLDVAFPLKFLFSAANYLDKYGPAERFNVLNQIDKLRLPSLFVFGEVELTDANFRGLPEAVAAAASPTQEIQVVTIGGANHSYTGQIDELSYKIRAWLTARS
jgi:pimeloyl-ACP methyl ester carboxylesterase